MNKLVQNVIVELNKLSTYLDTLPTTQEVKDDGTTMKLNEIKFCSITAETLVVSNTIYLTKGVYRFITNGFLSNGRMIDTLIYVKNSRGTLIGYNDDESGVNAKLTQPITEDGIYTIEVKSFGNAPAEFMTYVCDVDNYRKAGLK